MMRLIKAIRNPKRSLCKIGRKFADVYYARRNYRAFLKSNQPSVNNDLPYDKNSLEKEFIKYGYKPILYNIDIGKYREYLSLAHYPDTYCANYYAKYMFEKTLEHFLSFQFSILDSNSVVIDIANANSPFPSILHKLFNCKVFSNDLIFPRGINKLAEWHSQIGGNACNLPLPNNTCNLIVLHCALEMFEGNDDINLIKEASRLLCDNGKLVIVPLYMNETYHIFRDPKTPRRNLPEVDEGAKLIYRNFHKIAFARFYSVKALYERLIKNSKALQFTVYRVVNAEEIDQNCYVAWIGVFEKKNTTSE